MPYLRRRYELTADVLLVNGRVTGDTRERRVDAFQNRQGFDVMLLSPRAGGVGLTLTAANHVIHLSRWWSPAVEDQCTDRVFRIGQTRPVYVHLPMAVHPEFGEYSFDLKLDALLMSKRSGNSAILAPTKWSSDDVKALFDATTHEARRQSSMATADGRSKRAPRSLATAGRTESPSGAAPDRGTRSSCSASTGNPRRSAITKRSTI